VVGLLVLAVLLAACGSSGDDAPSGGFDLSDPRAGEKSPSGRTLLQGLTEVRVVIVAPDGTTDEVCVLLADDPAEWSQGLMEVVDLGGYGGMVFVFPEDRTGGFFMRNTPMPLSIVFLDEGGAVVSSTDMEPCEDRDGCSTYAAAGPYRLAVEVPQGDLTTIGLDEPEAILELAGACNPV
jgi:uncharacterized membrane protein (UPF0127 family)